MPLGELHKLVATAALRTAASYGFALGGSNALIAHGLIQRLTLDVDLLTDQEHGVEAAADAVEPDARPTFPTPAKPAASLEAASQDSEQAPHCTAAAEREVRGQGLLPHPGWTARGDRRSDPG
jgi:hypothetical protein